MDEELIEVAQTYAAKYALTLGESLGSGIHGRVCLLVKEGKPAGALKTFRFPEFFRREADAYRRLQEFDIRKIRGFAVPQLLRADASLVSLEMTLVSSPFVLAFASARLDWPPEFSDEIWEDWEQKNQEQFGDDWLTAKLILADLEAMGIYMLDPSPNNIRFR